MGRRLLGCSVRRQTTQRIQLDCGGSSSDEPGQIEDIIRVCRTHDLDHRVIDERGGDRFARRIVRVTSPGDVMVWFEGANESLTERADRARLGADRMRDSI
jgi:hypothetical protein